MICIICGKNSWSLLYKNLTTCNNCGFVRARDKYFKSSVKKLYSKKYFNGNEYISYREEKIALQKNFKHRLSKIKHFKKKGKLLEIGCAYGFFLELSQKDFSSTGIDVDKEVTKIAAKESGVRILQGEFLNKLFNSKFDVICMFDVIEHLKNPEKYIKKCFKLLNTGGILVIETGDISASLPSIQKDKWRLIYPPSHLHYFTNKNLEHLLKNNGFKIKYKTNNIPFYRTLKQTFYRLNLPKMPEFISKITFPTYTFDLTFIIAQK